ncbi:MAG: hypothetical protein V1664_02190 [Candidatus Uhrbacteria bacterium]
MKCLLPDFPSEGAFELMRWFGYAAHREENGISSFVRSPFTNEAQFPRFHASVCVCGDGLQVNVHLDQENNQGHGNHQFVWAYHNPLVYEEVQRLQALFEKGKDQVIALLPAKPLNKKIKTPGKIISFLAKRKILCRFF